MAGHAQLKCVMAECSKTNSLDAAQLFVVELAYLTHITTCIFSPTPLLFYIITAVKWPKALLICLFDANFVLQTRSNFYRNIKLKNINNT